MIWRAFHGRANQQAADVPRVLHQVVTRYRHQYEAVHVIAALDDRQNFRQALYPPYKQHRPEKPAQLEQLLRDAAHLMRAAGALPAVATHHEADDVLGTLARRAPGLVVIVTSDRDLYSVITDTVHVHDPRTHARLRPADVTKLMGVPPDRIALLKCLAGDSSDNIPGVRGIGEKSAAVIATRCATVDEVFEQMATFDPRCHRALQAAQAHDVHLYHHLATVQLDAPVRVAPAS